MAGFRASPLKPLPNRSAKSRMDEYTQQQLGTRCSGQLSIQPNVLGNLSCSALGQHVDQVASGQCLPLDGIDDNISDLSCSTMPHTQAAACRACVTLFPTPVRSEERRVGQKCVRKCRFGGSPEH